MSKLAQESVVFFSAFNNEQKLTKLLFGLDVITKANLYNYVKDKLTNATIESVLIQTIK